MYRKILVALDGSELAEKVLDQAKGLARLTGAELALLRVAEAWTFPGVDPTEAQVVVVDQAKKYLAGVVERLEAEGFRVSCHVRYGHPAGEIVDHAAEEGIDLVAMTTHGLTGLGRWAIGGVARRVVQHCPKPVLIIRA